MSGKMRNSSENRMSGARRILYVDSDRESQRLMLELLAPHETDIAATDDEARRMARQMSYDIYIVSGGSLAYDDIALCAWLHRVDPRTPIVFCSSNASTRRQQAAVAAGALRSLVKPLDPSLLRSTLNLLLKLADFESARAMAVEQQAISDELMQRSRDARAVATHAQEKLARASESLLRAKAYRAFLDAGGNRANFERMWPVAYDRARAAAS